MSDSVTIYGASDDLIEVDGDIEDEFSNYGFSDPGGAYVYVSTGDIMRFRLEDEGWRVTIVHDSTGMTIGKRPDRDDDQAVTVTGPVAWVVATTQAPVLR